MDRSEVSPRVALAKGSLLARARAGAASVGCAPAELAALAVLAAGALAAMALLWVTARSPGPLEAAASSEQPGGGPQIESEALIVHVAGRVTAPGLYRLAGGSRVGDAIAAAGGPLSDAVIDQLNLARPLNDGEQVVVPALPATVAGEARAPAQPSAGAKKADGTLDLNLATADELQELPGIGPVLADRIVAHRESIGRFQAVGDLRQVTGIGEKTFQQLASLVSV
ncbi:MAG TPA: helix-hairpin-helix domain-containing protein [Egibacteraceae bacterium]|nr:helix-hairpin-helix domain-containing protein [Egibacteraceae bacterium]